jgi:hypothetical protein
MIDGIKRWLSGSQSTGTAGFEDIAAWADAGHYTFRGVQDEGFVIDGRLGTSLWRLEWGPSQRPYFKGHELRLRAEPGVQAELQLLVLTRDLQEQLEKSIFEQYVEDVQTRIDNQTPPEMRWLVMFPKLGSSDMGTLRDPYVALGNAKPWLQAWLRGPLSQALQARAAEGSDPLVLMLGRGRLMLRTTLATPTLAQIKRSLQLFETALREARRVHSDPPAGLTADSAASSASDWAASSARGTLDDTAAKP